MSDPRFPKLEAQQYIVAASATVPVDVNTEFVGIWEATAPFEINIQDAGWSDADKGLRFDAPPGEHIRQIKLRDTSGAGVTVTLLMGYGLVRDGRTLPLSGKVSVLAGASVATAAHVSVLAAAQGTVPANAGRQAVVIANPASNPREVWLGDAGASTGEGVPLYPGERIRLPVTGVVTVYNPHSAAQSVAYLDEVA